MYQAILVFLWFFGALFFIHLGIGGANSKPYGFGPYPAQLERIIDGDTAVMKIRVFPTLFVRVSVRFNGIDTPESSRRFAKCEQERTLGLAAKQFLKDFFHQIGADKSSLKLRLTNVRLGKYAGRVLADIAVKTHFGWVDLSETMINAGFARPYFGKKKSDWCN